MVLGVMCVCIIIVVSGATISHPPKNLLQKSLTNLTVSVVISHNLKPVKIPYANGRVSVRIFYKNDLIRFYLLMLLTRECICAALVRVDVKSHLSRAVRSCACAVTLTLVGVD